MSGEPIAILDPFGWCMSHFDLHVVLSFFAHLFLLFVLFTFVKNVLLPSLHWPYIFVTLKYRDSFVRGKVFEIEIARAHLESGMSTTTEVQVSSTSATPHFGFEG